MPIAPACPGCSKPVFASAKGDLPPWCPQCGASLKAAPRSEPLAAIPTPLGQAGYLPTVDAAPTESFFHACIPAFYERNHRLYRVYVNEGELWVFALGVGPVCMGEVMPRTRPQVTGYRGVAGAMAALEEAQQTHLAQRIREMDEADPATLRQFAASGDRSFIVAPEDVEWMTLAGPSKWTKWFLNVGHEAVLKFAHRSQGRWNLTLPGLRDARRAAEWLPRLFGNAVQIQLNWGRAGQQ